MSYQANIRDLIALVAAPVRCHHTLVEYIPVNNPNTVPSPFSPRHLRTHYLSQMPDPPQPTSPPGCTKAPKTTPTSKNSMTSLSKDELQAIKMAMNHDRNLNDDDLLDEDDDDDEFIGTFPTDNAEFQLGEAPENQDTLKGTVKPTHQEADLLLPHAANQEHFENHQTKLLIEATDVLNNLPEDFFEDVPSTKLSSPQPPTKQTDVLNNLPEDFFEDVPSTKLSSPQPPTKLQPSCLLLSHPRSNAPPLQHPRVCKTAPVLGSSPPLLPCLLIRILPFRVVNLEPLPTR